MLTAVILQIILIFLNAVFASAEIAVISCNLPKLKRMAEKGDKRAARLVRLTAQPAGFLSTIQVAITLAGLLGSAFAADNFAGPLVNAILAAGAKVSPETLRSVCVVLITVILAYFSLVFGELVPKRLAMKKAEQTALGLSGALSFVSVAFAPIVWLLTVSTNGLLRLLGVNPDGEGERVTGEEILLLAEEGSEKGSIDAEETKFIKNVFDFGKLSVGEVCTHRRDADVLFEDGDDAEWKKIIFETRHTYYPVCGRDADEVKGILCTKDYFRLDDKSRANVLKKAVFPAAFVAENTPANALFYQMKTTREYFAVVVDEYGGVSGIVTLRDLLEQLVGELVEKDDEAEYSLLKLVEGKWELTGLTPVEKAAEAFGNAFSKEEYGEFETFGGYVCALAGTLPADGSSFELKTERMHIRVLSVKDRRIQKMVVSLLPSASEKSAFSSAGLPGKKASAQRA